MEIHPLLINHIIEKVLKYNNEKYHTFRQVCHAWNQEGCNLSWKYWENYITFGKNFHTIEQINEISQLISSSIWKFPFGNIKLCPEIFITENHLLVENFFLKSWSILKRLSIRLDDQSTFTEFLISFHLPKLKSLIFEDRRCCKVAFTGNLLKALLLASAKNLEHLSLLNNKEMQQSFQENHNEEEKLKHICEIFNSVVLISLKNLEIDLTINNELLLCLGVKLKSLRNVSFSLKTLSFDGEYLTSFLQRHSHSLETLKLTGLCDKSQFRIKFPQLMPVLKFLKIQGWCQNISGVSFSETFPKTFPNLNGLYFDTWSNDESWNQFLSSNSKNVWRLKLPQEFQNNLDSGIIKSFTNLRVLQLHYQPSQEYNLLFENLFKNLTLIQEFTILQTYSEFVSLHCIDSLLTGLTPQECKRMNQITNYSSSEDRKPSLTNFTNLRFLDLTDILKYQAFISDVTGYLLLSMKSLEHLKISRSKLRKSCFYQLYQKFPMNLEHEMEVLHQEEARSMGKSSLQLPYLNNYCLIA